MTKATYVVAFDSASPSFDIEEIKTFIGDSGEFSSWWNHIPFVFLVRSDLDADGVADKIMPHAKGARFLVMEVDPSNSNGWLKRRSWEWIKQASGSRTDAASRSGG
jgi:hypothetical protein